VKNSFLILSLCTYRPITNTPSIHECIHILHIIWNICVTYVTIIHISITKLLSLSLSFCIYIYIYIPNTPAIYPDVYVAYTHTQPHICVRILHVGHIYVRTHICGCVCVYADTYMWHTTRHTHTHTYTHTQNLEGASPIHYRVTKMRRMPYLYRSFSAKEPYN